MNEYVPPPGSVATLGPIDLGGMRAVHLIGIGGAGMSGIAHILLLRGITVTGSDVKETPEVERLRAAGADVGVGHDAARVGTADAVVVSSAIADDNAELRAARDRGIPVVHRAQVLAALMHGQQGVAIAGTHGKTTTSSMLAVVLERAGLDPTYVVGGSFTEGGGNARSGAGEIVLAEADESDGSFLLLEPTLAVITNVDDDHLDFYGDPDQIDAAFTAFARHAGALVACGDDARVRAVLAASGRPAVRYGEGGENEVRLEIGTISATRSEGRIHMGERTIELSLPAPGRHLLLNATAVIAAAQHLGVDGEAAAETLSTFGGVRRRYEHRGEERGSVFVDDYAHHPAEISATLDAARSDPKRRIVAVFQPHRYTRTAAMSGALGASLAGADVVVVTDVYAAGEAAVPGVTGKLVIDGLVTAVPGKRAIYLPRRSDVAGFLAGELRPGDLVLTLGAGDVSLVTEETLGRLRGSPPREGSAA